jgi:hypothetical protein
MKIILLIILSISSLSAKSREIKRSFSTDFCTGFKEGTKKYNWKKCCIIHDLYFWAGGNKTHRKIADKKLKSCVRKKSNKYYANLIYLGVKTGSASPIKIKGKQWGNAWGNKSMKRKLKVDQINLLESSLLESQSPHLSQENIQLLLKDLNKLNTEKFIKIEPY